jgi:hypothetical protein
VGEMAKGNKKKKNNYSKITATKIERENTQPKLHADRPGHYIYRLTISKLQVHANSPCPHKETGQSGLPSCRGEMAKENKQPISLQPRE